jgi:hypothetical protein
MTVEATIVIGVLFAFLFFCYTHPFVNFMNSVLGKLLVVGLIVFYAKIDKIYGLLVCLLSISFYQLDSTKWITEGFFDMSGMCGACGGAKESPDAPPTPVTRVDLENTLPHRTKTEFQRKHCSIGGTLEYRGLSVKQDMTDIVYPEVKYENEYNTCNVCDENCGFQVEPSPPLTSYVSNK